MLVLAEESVFFGWKIHQFIFSIFLIPPHFALHSRHSILISSLPQSVVDYVSDAGLDTAAFPFDEIVAVGAK